MHNLLLGLLVLVSNTVKSFVDLFSVLVYVTHLIVMMPSIPEHTGRFHKRV